MEFGILNVGVNNKKKNNYPEQFEKKISCRDEKQGARTEIKKKIKRKQRLEKKGV